MPHGFFTIEQWKRPKSGKKSQWTPIIHLDADQSLTAAIQALEKRGKPGCFRVIQTQRQIWGEIVNGKLKLRKWHAGTPESLARTAQAFERDKGVWPVEKDRRERAEARRSTSG